MIPHNVHYLTQPPARSCTRKPACIGEGEGQQLPWRRARSLTASCLGERPANRSTITTGYRVPDRITHHCPSVHAGRMNYFRCASSMFLARRSCASCRPPRPLGLGDTRADVSTARPAAQRAWADRSRRCSSTASACCKAPTSSAMDPRCCSRSWTPASLEARRLSVPRSHLLRA